MQAKEKMKTILSIILLLSIPFLKEYSLLDWKENPIPNKEKIERLNHYKKKSWKVFNKENLPFARVIDYSKSRIEKELPIDIAPKEFSELSFHFNGNRVFQKLKDGWLIGFDNGEWGGGLYWYDNKGETNYKINNGNINDIFEINKEIFVVEGIAHLDISGGQIYKIIQEDDKWVEELFITLQLAPQVTIIDKSNNFIISNSSQIIKIGLDKKIEELIPKDKWNGWIYSNSMIIHENDLYVGMRSGIMKIDLNKEKVCKWLTKK